VVDVDDDAMKAVVLNGLAKVDAVLPRICKTKRTYLHAACRRQFRSLLTKVVMMGARCAQVMGPSES